MDIELKKQNQSNKNICCKSSIKNSFVSYEKKKCYAFLTKQ